MAEPLILRLFAAPGGREEGLASVFDQPFAWRFGRPFTIDRRKNRAIPHRITDCGASILPTSSRRNEVGQ